MDFNIKVHIWIVKKNILESIQNHILIVFLNKTLLFINIITNKIKQMHSIVGSDQVFYIFNKIISKLNSTHINISLTENP